MTDKPVIKTQYAPDKLLAVFTRTRFGLWLAVAIIAHAVFIATTSVPYIMDNWIDKEGALERKAKAEAARAAVTNQPVRTAAATNVPAVAGATGAAPAQTAGAPAPAAPANAASADNRTNTAVMKQITEQAKPGEIPPEPDDLGISIKDTNSR